MFLEQMQVGPLAVFSYLLGDEQSGEALVIDPASETEDILAVAKKNNLKIKYIVNTHGHADHISGNNDMKKLTGAQIIVHEEDAGMLTYKSPAALAMFQAKILSPVADITVKGGEYIRVGNISLAVLHTPGHSPGSMSLYMDGIVFTGDTLFVEAVGRTDFPGGSWNTLHSSVMEKLFTLPDETHVLPGHNYGRTPTSTIGHEKKYNPFLT